MVCGKWLRQSVAAAAVVGVILAAFSCGDSNGDDGTGGGSVCPTGQMFCGGECTDVAFDREHCGSCNVPCAAVDVCSQGACGSDCGVGTVQCDRQCVYLETDSRYCGDCNTACPVGELCDGSGACRVSCEPGLTECDGRCVHLLTDVEHCGTCDYGCFGGEICNGQGHCSPSCAPGLILCGAACIDPRTDDAYCGASGDCLGPNGGTTCGDREGCDEGHCVALPCEDLWEQTPHANDAETTPTSLSAEPVLDCALEASTSGVLDGAGDVDWYRYQGQDDSCIVNPFQQIEQLDEEARLCAFVDCVDDNAATLFPCPEGTTQETSPGGLSGCCASGTAVEFTIQGLNCSGSVDDSAYMLLRIDAPSAAADACIGYQLRFNY